MTSLGNVLVIGGCGFLGSHIVDLLLSSYTTETVSVLSRCASKSSNKTPGVNYFDGDLTELQSILPTFRNLKFDVVIHTVSPPPTTSTQKEFQLVNVEGTRNIIEAAMETGVKALVYSSTGAVVQGDFKTRYENADETWPVITRPQQKDPYSWTKVTMPPILSQRTVEFVLNMPYRRMPKLSSSQQTAPTPPLYSRAPSAAKPSLANVTKM